MFARLQTDPAPDVAGEFRDRVRRLGSPERHVIEATRVRIMLARASRIGLRERLDHAGPAHQEQRSRSGGAPG
ncbi:MAG: hypothetical protein A2Z32_09480 [Chloroflexi bacterium RBG_16_69_14]|nr:MAG: hypothetical protein A2Z32_09480 [Chloroflexi bacterium RBG_16_69_14]